jgi:hypothetical protein
MGGVMRTAGIAEIAGIAVIWLRVPSFSGILPVSAILR